MVKRYKETTYHKKKRKWGNPARRKKARQTLKKAGGRAIKKMHQNINPEKIKKVGDAAQRTVDNIMRYL